MRALVWTAFIGSIVFAAACDGETEPAAVVDSAVGEVDAGGLADVTDMAPLLGDDGVDDGVPAPAAPPTDFALELGLGDRVFIPVDVGDVAPLQRGCQGAQHVWISLRSPELNAAELRNTLSAIRVDDGLEAVPSHTLELPWVEAGEGAALIGVTLVMFDPVAVVGQLVDLHAEVETADGRVGRAVIRVRVEWGPDAC